MKNLLLALTLGLSLSVVAQDNSNGNVREIKVEATGNQITPSKTTSTPTYTPTNSTHVRNQTPVNDYRRDDDYRRVWEQDDYRYGRGSNIDNVYNGRYYTPPTRNQLRYDRGQQCFTQFEINTRPFSLANGFWNVGLELSTSCKTSFLFDFSSGTSTLFDVQATSGMVGFRFYSKTDMVGRYLTTRARLRSYENGQYYGGNLSLMVGYKANWNGVTTAAEVGIGYQGADGEYISIPTFAITIGYKL